MIYQASYYDANRRLMKEVTFPAESLEDALEIMQEQPQLMPPSGAADLELKTLATPAAADDGD